MEKEGLPLPLVQVSGNDKGVNLLTAHGSKGLEFEYVFIAGCNTSLWEKKRKPGGGYKIPENVFESHNNSAAAKREGTDVEELAPFVLCSPYPRRALPEHFLLPV